MAEQDPKPSPAQAREARLAQALRAARWVNGRAGWYSMRDVLGIVAPR